ncbi:MAG: hypothetical protein KA354_00645 [Phycisphaerae bacterium]|nr:hypothetical protein [Phycisphaerae bacterium]
MPDPRPISTTPGRTRFTWFLAAVAGIAALAMGYGLAGASEPLVSSQTVQLAFRVCASLFVLSRLLMLVPLRGLGVRLRCWWVDYVLLLGGLAWWLLNLSRGPMVLELITCYCLAMAVWAIAYEGLKSLTRGAENGRVRAAGWRLLTAGLLLAVLAGAVLALPACWHGEYPVPTEGDYVGYRLASHWLRCTFTATAALTGTGLSLIDIGQELSRAGQTVVLVLMQFGGLAILAIGAVAGWRLRRLAGWGCEDDNCSPHGPAWLIVFTLILALGLEAVGAWILLPMWGDETHPPLSIHNDQLFASAFHAVSAFCNVGLTLESNGLVAKAGHYGVFAAILPLMILGSLGGPVLYDLFRRVLHLRGLGLSYLSRHFWLAVAGSAVVTALGAALLVGIEKSPRRWQLRNPRSDTPGRLMVATAPSTSTPATAASLSSAAPASAESPPSQPSERAKTERLQSQSRGQCWASAFFQSAATRTGGMRIVRLDENSLAPASRLVLMCLMLAGGEVGGTAGGIRLMVLFLILGTLFSRSASSTDATSSKRAVARQHVLTIAVGATFSLLVIIALTTLALTFREAGSPQACLFEAVSVGCNVGFSAGLTGPHLSTQGIVILILSMLFSRIVPLAILLRSRLVSLATVHPQRGDND